MGIVAVFLIGCLTQECPNEVTPLILQLGSNSIKERDDAAAQLYRIGEPALPDLERSLDSSDAEIKARARSLIARIAPHREEVLEEVIHLFLHASSAFRGGRYHDCLSFSELILHIDSEYAPARRLRDESERCIRDDGSPQEFLKVVETWWLSARNALDLPSDLVTLHYPSRAAWADIRGGLVVLVTHHVSDAPNSVSIQHTLHTKKVNVAFENAKLDDILTYIRDISGLNIVVDAANGSPADPIRLVTLKAKDLILKDVLKLLPAETGLNYVVTEEGVVLLTDSKRVCRLDE